MIGRYLDDIVAAGEWDAVDRVIQAQAWTTRTVSSLEGNACLVGHVCFFKMDSCGLVRMYGSTRLCKLSADYGLLGYTNRFDRLVDRFGMDRVVRCIKNRLGRATRPNVEPAATLIDSAVKELAMK